MRDIQLIKEVALPNAGATVVTAAIALPQRATRPFSSALRLRMYTTVGTGVDTKIITAKLQASNDPDSNFVDIPEFASLAITAASSLYAAASREVYLPPNLNKMYVRATATGESGGGNASNGVLGIEFID